MTRERATEIIKLLRQQATRVEADDYEQALDMAISALARQESLIWERDVAIKQLEDLGYGFGEKIEPCDKCVYSTKDGYCQYDDVTETIPPLEPCDDAISREAVKELIKSGVSTDTYDDVEQVCKWIDALPSVTQKSGKWIERQNIARTSIATAIEFRWTYECSKCGHEVRHKTRFCASCGAKMESEVNE